MLKKYTKKPTIVEAIQWTGSNFNEIRDIFKSKVTLSGNLITLDRRYTVCVGDYICRADNKIFPIMQDDIEFNYEEVE